VVQGFPVSAKPARHLQASSEMFFDVFEEFDPENLLLDQARREVLQAQLEIARLAAAMERTAGQALLMVRPATLTPLSFPIWAEHLRNTTLSSEKWADMVRKMVVELEEEAGGRRAKPAGGESRGKPAVEVRARRARGRAAVGR